LAAYAFARFDFAGRDLVFMLVLMQLMVMPDVLIVENYRTMSRLGLLDTVVAIGLPYMASAFGIFLLRQTFKTVPRELDEAARVEGAGFLQMLWKLYVPLAKPVFLAYALVSVSYHWNNFLWPLIVTNSVTSRPVTVGLQVFSSGDQGVDWSIITAATLLTSGPLLVAFLLFQRQFVQSFMRAGIRCRPAQTTRSAMSRGSGARLTQIEAEAFDEHAGEGAQVQFGGTHEAHALVELHSHAHHVRGVESEGAADAEAPSGGRHSEE